MAYNDAYAAVSDMYDSDTDWQSILSVGSPDGLNIAAEALESTRDDDATAIRIRDLTTGADETYTYRELDAAANRVANYLTAHTEEKDRVAALLPLGFELHAVLYGAIKAGRIFVPISPKLEADGIDYRLEHSGTRLLATTDVLADDLETSPAAVERILAVGSGDSIDTTVPVDSYEGVRDYSTSYDTVTAHPTDVYAITYTSGTTGDPKGCLNTHRERLQKLHPHYEYVLDMGNSETYMTSGSPTARPSRTLGAHVWDTTVVYYRGDFEPEPLLEAIEEIDVDTLSIPPTAFRQLRSASVDVTAYDVDLSVISTGGESIDRESVEWAKDALGAPPLVGYGLTEIGMISCNYSFGDWKIKPGSLGRELPGLEVDVVDEDGTSVDPGTVGELIVERRRDSVGWYWNAAEKSVDEFGGAWHHTGDLVRRDDDGFLWFISRKKYAFYANDELVWPEQIEDEILQHDDVEEVGVQHTDGDEPLIEAKITPSEPNTDPESLKRALEPYLRDRLPEHKRPDRLAVVTALPKTATGKIRRTDL